MQMDDESDKNICWSAENKLLILVFNSHQQREVTFVSSYLVDLFN